MIRKAQIKFVAITMSILFGVFFIISLVSANIIQNVHVRNIDITLNDTAKAYQDDSSYSGPNVMLSLLQPNGESQTISADPECFTDNDIKNIIKASFLTPNRFGKTENFYYKTFNVNGQNILIAFDATDNLASVHSTQVKLVLSLLLIFGILFIIVYLMSFKVFQPIKDAFMKQKQFVSNASHELKTPLSIISANTDVLKQTEENQWLDNIKNQTERLNDLVNDMLDMAKIDENKPILTKEEFDLSDEIIKNTLPFDAVAFEKGKTLMLDVQPNIIYQGDRQSVKKVINILLDNAVKYANYNGVIKVSFHKKNSRTILSVFNTGSAVPDKEANKVFERFYRIDNSRSRSSGGSGLGLSIAKAIADANRWKISATSKIDEYMIITLIF